MSKSARDFSSILFILILLLFHPHRIHCSSQGQSSLLISKIVFLVDQQEGGKEFENLISLREGDAYSLKTVTQSIKQIFQTGLFSDVQVMASGEKQLTLTFSLTKKLFVRKIVIPIEGRGLFSKNLKETLLSLREGGLFSEEKMVAAEEELKQALAWEGYFKPQINVSFEKIAKMNAVDVHFQVDKGERFTIDSLTFSGDIILSENDIRKRMESKEGQLYIPEKLEQDLERLKKMYYDLGYQRVEIEVAERNFLESEKLVSLNIKINPRELIKIFIEGADVPLSLVRPIWEEKIFEEWGLVEGEARILSYLRKKGYIFASLNSRLEKSEKEVRVIYKINPGQKHKIEDLSFEGLKYFTEARLRKELEISGRIPLLSWIDGAQLFEIPKRIEIFYQNHGFPSTRVDLNFLKKDKAMRAVYYIEEGTQQKVGRIDFQGASLFDRQLLLSQVGSYEGGPFFQPNVQRDVEKLENFYLNQGVRGTKISARVENTGENTFSLIFIIEEGRRVTIDKIIITGNVVTQKGVILRELQIKEGDYAFADAIMDTKRRLEKLGIFTEVKIEEILLSPERESLIINLREGERNYASMGVGLETRNEPQLFNLWNNVIRLRGTAEFIRSNIFGTASQLSLVGQMSIKEKRGVISWEQPDFFGLSFRTYLNGWLEREERKSFGYDRRGVSLTGIKALSEEMSFLMTLRWARTTLYFLEISESEVDRQHFPFSATSLSGSFIWDRRNDAFNPEKGFFLSSVLEWAYPLFKVESNYLKSFIKYQHFLPIRSRLLFSTTFRLGLGRGRMPIHERFFAGGSNSFRGEEFDELGPKDPRSQNPVGGKALILFNFEFTFPLLSRLKNLSGVVFYDAGDIFAKRKDFDLLALQDALGLGLRYRTPLGPLRVELAWNLDRARQTLKPLFFITIGNVF